MNGIKRDSRRLGYGAAPMPTPDPDAHEDTCPGCGTYTHLKAHGYCGEDACSAAILAGARAQSRESGKTVIPGRYYRFGETEIVSLDGAPQHHAPEVPTGMKHPDLCTHTDCDDFARPHDTLCPTHRIQANSQRHAARKAQRHGSPRRRKGRGGDTVRNQIRGLEKLAALRRK
jgi:hypothetical protein